MSFFDKVKDAFGMNDDADTVVTDTDTDRLGTDDVVNRPAGPDYGAEETIDREFGVGLDREEMTGTAEHDTGTGLDYDFDRGAVTDDDDVVVVDRHDTGA